MISIKMMVSAIRWIHFKGVDWFVALFIGTRRKRNRNGATVDGVFLFVSNIWRFGVSFFFLFFLV